METSLFKSVQYVLKVCDRHEFEHPIFEFHSAQPFGTISVGDYIKPKEIDQGHPGQAFSHRVEKIYHYIYPTGKMLVHVTKLIVEKSQDPNKL